MKTLYNAVLALLLTGFICNIQAQDDVEALQDAISSLEADIQLYNRLQFEVEEIAKQFDESAETRRHLQCCVAYKVDALNQNYVARENELLAIIADKDQSIADLEERFEIFKAEAAAELDALSNMVEVLTIELGSYRDLDAFEADRSDEDLFELMMQVQDAYAAMEEQRLNLLAKLESLAAKAYGHFEVEAIENTVFGERICGTLYCPLLDDEPVDSEIDNESAELEVVDDQSTQDAQNTAEVTVGDASVEDAFAAYVAHWDVLVPE